MVSAPACSWPNCARRSRFTVRPSRNRCTRQRGAGPASCRAQLRPGPRAGPAREDSVSSDFSPSDSPASVPLDSATAGNARSGPSPGLVVRPILAVATPEIQTARQAPRIRQNPSAQTKRPRRRPLLKIFIALESLATDIDHQQRTLLMATLVNVSGGLVVRPRSFTE